MPKTHIVAQGECFTAIATSYGFTDYRSIYDHPSNAELKRRRPNPNVLYPGDRIVIPEKVIKTEKLATGQAHWFRIGLVKRVLRIAVEDACWHRVVNEPYQLRVGGATRSGRTDASGLLEQEIPEDAQSAQLVVKDHTWDLDIAHLNPTEGDSDDEGVSGAQGRLLNLGYDVGPIDSDAGPLTQNALRRFQRDHGLESTGELNDVTRAALIEVHGC